MLPYLLLMPQAVEGQVVFNTVLTVMAHGKISDVLLCSILRDLLCFGLPVVTIEVLIAETCLAVQ